MKIKRYQIVPDPISDNFRVIDRLKDGYVCVPLTHTSEEGLAAIMGNDMNVEVDSEDVHPDYLRE